MLRGRCRPGSHGCGAEDSAPTPQRTCRGVAGVADAVCENGHGRSLVSAVSGRVGQAARSKARLAASRWLVDSSSISRSKRPPAGRPAGPGTADRPRGSPAGGFTGAGYEITRRPGKADVR